MSEDGARIIALFSLIAFIIVKGIFDRLYYDFGKAYVGMLYQAKAAPRGGSNYLALDILVGWPNEFVTAYNREIQGSLAYVEKMASRVIVQQEVQYRYDTNFNDYVVVNFPTKALAKD